jgi:hypothetical protein
MKVVRAANADRNHCVNCQTVYDKHRKSTASYKLQQRRYELSKRYGLTIEEVQDLVVVQEGKCACCDTPVNEYSSVDHNHKTAKVRGLLCKTCNFAAGFLKDDPDACRKLAAYLEREKHG